MVDFKRRGREIRTRTYTCCTSLRVSLCLVVLHVVLCSLLALSWIYFIYAYFVVCFSPIFQEDQNRGKPNWEHLNDELHVLITVEDSENRANMKLQRAVDEVKKLLTVVRKRTKLMKSTCLSVSQRPSIPTWFLSPLTSFLVWRRRWVKEKATDGAGHHQRHIPGFTSQKLLS